MTSEISRNFISIYCIFVLSRDQKMVTEIKKKTFFQLNGFTVSLKSDFVKIEKFNYLTIFVPSNAFDLFIAKLNFCLTAAQYSVFLVCKNLYFSIYNVFIRFKVVVLGTIIFQKTYCRFEKIHIIQWSNFDFCCLYLKLSIHYRDQA